MSERSHQAVEKESSEALPEPMPSREKEQEKGQERPSLLEMLFREAEVISQNLKESGTRR